MARYSPLPEHIPYQLDCPDLDVRPGTYYTETNARGRPVTYTVCQVCHYKIHVAEKMEDQSNLSIVDCPNCKELTPFKDAPEGFKFVRCICHMLNTCNRNAKQIMCSRAECRKVIKLVNEETSVIGQRYSCAYCFYVFEVTDSRHFARCEQCGSLSSLGENHSSVSVCIYTIIGVLLCGGGAVTAVFTYKMALDDCWPLYIAWAAFGLLAFLCFLRAGWSARIQTSYLLGEIN